MHLAAQLSVAQVVTTLVLIAITATRFLNAAKPFWNRLPLTLRWLPPVLVVVLPLLAEQLKVVATPADLVVALLVAAGMIVPNHEERIGTQPALLLFLLGSSLALAPACASSDRSRDIRSAIDAARAACLAYGAAKAELPKPLPEADQLCPLLLAHDTVPEPSYVAAGGAGGAEEP